MCCVRKNKQWPKTSCIGNHCMEKNKKEPRDMHTQPMRSLGNSPGVDLRSVQTGRAPMKARLMRLGESGVDQIQQAFTLFKLQSDRTRAL